MRKWLVFLLLSAFIIFPSPAGAEAETKLDSLNIELRSEYDRPSMLVISRFVVSRDTPLPALVTLRFPKEANLYAVALEKNGEPFYKAFTSHVEQGIWQTVTINVESYDTHRIEYYEPLIRDGNKREFKYLWYGDYYVKLFNITIIVPGDRKELVTSPVLESTANSSDGVLFSGKITKTDMKLMNSFQFELQYQRTSVALTSPYNANRVQPSEPIGANTPGRVSITNLPWIIGGFGLALIVIALFSYWRSTQSGEQKPKRRRQSQNEVVAESGPAGQAYCHECGARAHTGDRFCRTCGSRLRIE